MTITAKDISDFESNLDTYIGKINARIADALDDILRTAPGRDHLFVSGVYKKIYDYLENGGKRMHGVSVLLAYFMSGGKEEKVILPVAAAFQLYHHHTLLHDDIYDEDLNRRGMPTAHAAFATSFANGPDDSIWAAKPAREAVFTNSARRKGVMAGFALGKIVHAIAFELIATAPIEDSKVRAILQRLNYHDLADNAAQLRDVYHEGAHLPSSRESLQIAYAKTGILFELGVECATLLTDSSPARSRCLREWVSFAAQAYQLQDDLEDLAADSEKGKGRGIASDLRTQKPTFILATAMEQAAIEEKALLDSYLSNTQIGIDKMLDVLEETSALEICKTKVRKLVQASMEVLDDEEAGISEKDKHLLACFTEFYVSDRYWKRSLPGSTANRRERITRDKIDHVIFDLHGVLIGPQEMFQPRHHLVAGIIRELRSMGLQLLFVTNSSSMSRRKIVELLAAIGIEAKEHETASAGLAMAKYLKKHYHRIPIYVIGKPGFREILAEVAGESIVEARPEEARLVVAGGIPVLSPHELDAAKRATINGAALLATSREMMVPMESGMVRGPGWTIRALETAMGIEATIIGKPNAFMLTDLLCMDKHMLCSTVIVGDNEEVDTGLGKATGAYTAHLTLESSDSVQTGASNWTIGKLEDLTGIIRQFNKRSEV